MLLRFHPMHSVNCTLNERMHSRFRLSSFSAQLEYALLNYFNQSLDSYKMQFCAGVNAVKSFVVEAFGYHFSDIKNVFNIVGKQKLKKQIQQVDFHH
jgi:hypothetical protein